MWSSFGRSANFNGNWIDFKMIYTAKCVHQYTCWTEWELLKLLFWIGNICPRESILRSIRIENQCRWLFLSLHSTEQLKLLNLPFYDSPNKNIIIFFVIWFQIHSQCELLYFCVCRRREISLHLAPIANTEVANGNALEEGNALRSKSI